MERVWSLGLHRRVQHLCHGPASASNSASKFALEALSDALRAEVKPWGIDVSIVEPGSIKSEIWKKSHIEVDEILRSLLPDGVRYYGPEIEAFHNLIANSERAAVPPERVATVVEHALTARRPRTRYLVGFDAKLMAFLHWLLPDRAFDGLLAMATRRLTRGEAGPRDAKPGAPQDHESEAAR